MNCYVLAGGRSERMGAPKASLPFAGSTFLGRVVDAARPVFDRVLVVERNGGSTYAIDTIFEDPHDDAAPIFGVQRALADAVAKCFVLAVDYPLLDAATLRAFVARFEVSDATMLVPIAGGHPHVLCAGYSPDVLPLIEAQIARRQYDLRSIARGAETFPFEGVELMNVNTPQELEEAERLYERQRLLASR
jgi:molybdopterin-guanine dinucleotide biosynthesis protein A